MKTQAEAFTKSFVRNSMRTMTSQKVSEMLDHKAVLLQYARPQQKDRKRTSRKAKGLNARQKRELKVFQIKPEQQR